jgi:hypothetical protein
MDEERTYTAFAGTELIVRGALETMLRKTKARLDGGEQEQILIFDDRTGQQIDFDFRGTPDEVVARVEPPATAGGRGRPKLGVVSREISLLPRHWEWLEQQGSGISATLRRLVEQAMKSQAGKERARQLRDALCRFMTCMAGDRPNFEEACRSLYAGDGARFAAQVERWPKDIREYAVAQEQAAERAAKSDPA